MLGVIFTKTSTPRVIVDEAALPEPFRSRLQERRRVRPRWLVEWGIFIGFCLANAVTVAAQGHSDWMSPSAVGWLVGVIFGVGIAYNLLTDSRERIKKLEETSVSKEVHGLLRDAVGEVKMEMRAGFDAINERLDRFTSDR